MHKAKAAEWRAATSENRMATAADFAISVESVKANVEASGDVNSVLIYAQALEKCVTEALGGSSSDAMAVSDTAAYCVVLLKW